MQTLELSSIGLTQTCDKYLSFNYSDDEYVKYMTVYFDQFRFKAIYIVTNTGKSINQGTRSSSLNSHEFVFDDHEQLLGFHGSEGPKAIFSLGTFTNDFFCSPHGSHEPENLGQVKESMIEISVGVVALVVILAIFFVCVIPVGIFVGIKIYRKGGNNKLAPATA